MPYRAVLCSGRVVPAGVAARAAASLCLHLLAGPPLALFRHGEPGLASGQATCHSELASILPAACPRCRDPALPLLLPALCSAYWSPAATTGQRYIYTGSFDGRVVVYGERTVSHPSTRCFRMQICLLPEPRAFSLNACSCC